MPAVEGEVTTTASCLQIIDFEVGEGDAVQPGGIVSVHFTGYLEDGTIFDTSRERGQPIAFSLDRVMQGWQEGVQGMQVGGMRRLIVPAELATGTFGFGPSAPPDATLIFDIELLEIAR
ncbi:MAG: FKBP-type peptidyl-prolyl cis-trans isomerase [Chloroflexi bacterium]|nr:FKBP-type peptidyl-prolyl cis-trans isomerase [Chloroflexota bacterium]